MHGWAVLPHSDGICWYRVPMSDAPRGWQRPALVSVLYLAMASSGIVWANLRADDNVWRWEGKGPFAGPGLGLLLGFGVGISFVLGSRFSTHRYEWGRALHQELRARLGPMTNFEIFLLAGASSLGEEIFFRGALFPATGIWLSSLIFALLHVGPKLRFLPWTVASFVAGVAFCLLFKWSGDLSGPVVAHFTVNLLNLRYLSVTDLR